MKAISTAEQVADYLRVHLITVPRRYRDGMLPVAKVERVYRIKKVDLDGWWEEHPSSPERGARWQPKF